MKLTAQDQVFLEAAAQNCVPPHMSSGAVQRTADGLQARGLLVISEIAGQVYYTVTDAGYAALYENSPRR
jgi:hypothetical protein